ncbi:MAG: FtsK/SpoIIIE domain-containing protein [Kineosporiaceae bacterium]
MKIKLSLHRPSGALDDLVVTADNTASVGAVADLLLRCDPQRDRSASSPLEPGGSTLSVARGGAYVTVDPLLSLSESGLRSGMIVTLSPAPRRIDTAGLQPAAAVVTVVAGPNSGARFEIPAGVSVIGRSPECSVRLDDPAVSKHHARLTVSDTVELTDLNSANSILVGGSSTRRVSLGPNDTAVLGDSEIRVMRLDRPADADQRAQGLAFNRSPRVLAAFPDSVVPVPEPPTPPEPHGFPLIAILIPLLMAGVLFAVTRSPSSILFAALSPLMYLGQWLEQRLSGRRGFGAAERAYRKQLAELRGQLQEQAAREVVHRGLEHPCTADVVEAIRHRDALLWARRPDDPGFLALRLGVGDAASRTTLELPRLDTTTPELRSAALQLAQQNRQVGPVPIVGTFVESGSLGVAGPMSEAVPVARGLLTQLAGLHSPADLTLAVVTDAAGAVTWSWLRWLPHTGSEHSPLTVPHLSADAVSAKALSASLEELVELRRAESEADSEATGGPRARVILVVDDEAPLDRARLVWLAEHGPAVGVHLLWLAPTVERLPAPCRRFLLLGPAGSPAQIGDADTGEVVDEVWPEAVTEETAMGLGRLLAPVDDAGARIDDATDLPSAVSLLSLAGTSLAEDSQAVRERWAASGSLTDGSAPRPHGHTLAALIGQSGTEKFYLDLRAQGPHALVGGTTGAGKSEFLQSWVLGLATTYSPRRVTFLFVDYKGGAAFGECRNLPHTVGLITDLTPSRFARTLISLRAELKTREHLLNTKKAKDLLDLEKRGDPDCPPSLVIVVDEFAALVQDVPEFVDGMVDVAQRGRSLGLHLILATQRPAGVIRDNLRANTNLRVALRMADESDSTDVLGSPSAGAIPPGLPGRGYAKTGPGRLTAFQAGYAGGWTTAAPPPPSISVESLSFGPPLRWEEPEVHQAVDPATLGPTDIQRMVHVIRRAAQDAQLPPPRKPWLATLASAYRWEDLPSRQVDDELVFAVLDDPDHQEQREVAFHPDVEGNLAVFGTGGAGKSTLLRTLAVAAGDTGRGGPCEVYGLDFGSRGLALLEPLPHVGSIVSGEDRERLARLLRRLRSLIDDRAARFARAGAGTIPEYRERAGRPDEARVLVLVDGVGTFRQTYEAQREALWDQFVGIAADGRQVGVHVVVSADRPTAVTSALNSVIQKRVVLRLASADDYSSFGLKTDVLGTSAPPGRGLLDGHEIQVAVLGGTANTAEQGRAVTEFAERLVGEGRRPAEPVRVLEPQVPLGELPAERSGLPVIGVDGAGLEPLGVDLHGTWLLAGPPGSGRTTCLATMVLAGRRSGAFHQFVYYGPGTSSLVRMQEWSESAIGEDAITRSADVLVERLQAPSAPATLIVVESVGDYLDGAVDTALSRLAKACANIGHGFIAEGESSTFSGNYGTSLWPVLKNARRGILLQPDSSDGDLLLRTAVPAIPRAEAFPGRGYLVRPASVSLIQIALPEVADDHAATRSVELGGREVTVGKQS